MTVGWLIHVRLNTGCQEWRVTVGGWSWPPLLLWTSWGVSTFAQGVEPHSPPANTAVIINHCCQTLSGVVVCPSLAISTEQIHARTTIELCSLALRTLLQIGDEGLAIPDNRGSERWRPTCVHWILAWRRQSDASRTERHGGDSWQRQRQSWQAPEWMYTVFQKNWYTKLILIT